MHRWRRALVSLGVLLLLDIGAGIAAEFPDTIARVKPSIVTVGTFNRLGSPQFVARGTGFAVGDGTTIATNAHVIEGQATGNDGATLVVQTAAVALPLAIRSARVWAVDNVHDLALLRIDGPALPVLGLRDSDSAREGQAVAFTGFPLAGIIGFTPVSHRATISAITPMVLPGANAHQLSGAMIHGLNNGAFNVFQLDGTAYPGNSGGPLYDVESGEVIGIINMVAVKRMKEAALSSPSGISYAIPANHLRALLAKAH